MSNDKVICLKGHDALFVSLRYPQLDLVLNADEERADGRPARPKFLAFHPGPAGGELRVKGEKLVAALRERDKMDAHYKEVTSDEEYAQACIARDKFVVDDGKHDRVARGAVKEAKAAPSNPAPENVPAPAPKAARGPRRQAVPA